jgi:hypothetical protein
MIDHSVMSSMQIVGNYEVKNSKNGAICAQVAARKRLQNRGQ